MAVLFWAISATFAAADALPGLCVSRLLPTGPPDHPFDQFEVTFDRAVLDGSLTTAEVAMTGPGGPITPLAVDQLAPDRYQITLSGLTGRDIYSLTISTAVRDAANQPLDQDHDGTPGEPADAYQAKLISGPFTIGAADPSSTVSISSSTDRPSRSTAITRSLTLFSPARPRSRSPVQPQTSRSLGRCGIIGKSRRWHDSHHFGLLKVTGNSTLVCQGKNTWAQIDGQWAGVGVTIHAGNVTVEAARKSPPMGRGMEGRRESPEQRPWARRRRRLGGNSGGGGYGGRGAAGASTGGGSYGSATFPTELGSGGGGAFGDNNQGYCGDGAIRLEVAGRLALDGSITAHGEGGVKAGGSGGSLYVTTNVLAGAGVFGANGGSLYGGGGRIAVYYADGAGYTGFSGCTVNGSNGGENGTVGFITTAGTNPKLDLFGRFEYPADSNLTFEEVRLSNGARLTLGGGTTLNVTGDLIVADTSTIIAKARTLGRRSTVNGPGWA